MQDSSPTLDVYKKYKTLQENINNIKQRTYLCKLQTFEFPGLCHLYLVSIAIYLEMDSKVSSVFLVNDCSNVCINVAVILLSSSLAFSVFAVYPWKVNLKINYNLNNFANNSYLAKPQYV